LVMDSRLSQVNWFDLHLSWGKGTILRAFCSSALWQICISPLGCRSAGLHLLRMQESQCPPWGMGHSLICLRSPDPTNPLSETSTQLLLGRGAMTHLATSC
jgi:hypothetical protein